MVKRSGAWLPTIILGILGLGLWFIYKDRLLPPFLTFSDGAKFADIARNFVQGVGFGASSAPFNKEFLEISGLLPIGIPPLYPFLIALGFKMFGIQDLVVILTSGFFYLGSAIVLYFLGRKLFGELVGFLAALAFIFDPAMLNYATTGASEPLFIFELILAALLFYLNTKKSLFFGFLTLIALYFTRPSAIIYILGFIILFILLRFQKKGQILKAFGVVVVLWLLFEASLLIIGDRFFLYSPVKSFLFGVSKFSPLSASTEVFRGGMVSDIFQPLSFFKKLFYNLYNFYKLLPQILSSYLVGFYLLSLFHLEREGEKKIFRGLVLFFVLATFFAAAATLPIYRYLHPVIPFVYLLGIEMIVWTVGKIFTQKKVIFSVALGLVFFFIIGQSLGKIFLDSRFIRSHTNQGKPPVYVKLSLLLGQNIKPDDLIITNLDTWGSWYGERKTIWYPLEPAQLIPELGKKLQIDAIYLTSYKIDDENYYMGENWREIFLHPNDIKDKFIAQNFLLKAEFEIKSDETFENEPGKAVLLVRK